MSLPRITIDTNCVINLLDHESRSATSVAELRTLVRYAMEGKIEIAVTTRLEADLRKDKDGPRRTALLGSLNMFPVISTVARWDVSKWDEDIWVGDGTARLNEEIRQILAPGLTNNDARFSNKINDIDHLTGHAIDRRDIFVTDDRGILRRREQLARGPSIFVMTPAQCLEHVDGVILRSAPRTLPADGLSPKYHSRGLQGAVTFDYTNNNGSYALGEAQHLFETKWSRASNTAIHAYSDANSIQALALATSVSSIETVADAESFDFSSRVRTPQLGQIVIWRNVNGLYAATKVVSVADDTRGDATSEVTFEYVILPDGGRNFSKA